MPFWGSPALMQQPPITFVFRTYDANVNGTTYAGLRLNADGSMDQRTGNITYSQKGRWVTPDVTTEVFSVYIGVLGAEVTGDVTNTWLQIGNGTAREWYHNFSTLNRAYTIYLSFDPGKSGTTPPYAPGETYDASFTGVLSVP